MIPGKLTVIGYLGIGVGVLFILTAAAVAFQPTFITLLGVGFCVGSYFRARR